jgi:hypothetical protein
MLLKRWPLCWRVDEEDRQESDLCLNKYRAHRILYCRKQTPNRGRLSRYIVLHSTMPDRCQFSVGSQE